MSENKVLAEVEGKEITQEDLDGFLSGLAPQVAMQFQSPEGMKKLLEELINQEVLYLDAVENKFDEEEAFKSELERVRTIVLKQYAIRKLISDISATEEEIVDYYNEHKDQFTIQESVMASHILVEEEEEANKVIEEINNGLSFEEAASKYSICPSKANGGSLGEFTRGKMVPEFEEVAFDIEEGKLSEPIKTEFGYHLIKVESRKEATTISLEESKDQINKIVVGLKQQDRYFGKTGELKKKYEVKVNL